MDLGHILLGRVGGREEKTEKQDLSRDSGLISGEKKWRHNYTIMHGSKQEQTTRWHNISE